MHQLGKPSPQVFLQWIWSHFTWYARPQTDRFFVLCDSIFTILDFPRTKGDFPTVNISSLWFFWAISLGFDKSWFDGDDLRFHCTIRKKHKKKTRKTPVFGSSLKKKSHPTPGGYSKWLDDFLPRCYRNWRLQPVLGQESPGKLSTKSDSKTIRVWDLIIEAFLLEKNREKQNISNEQNQIQASQVSKKWDVQITFLNNRIQKREMFISLLSTFCHLFWTHF